jgi:hypothetical protein
MVTRAARSSAAVLFPTPGSPASSVILPLAIRPGQSHRTASALTSLSRDTAALSDPRKIALGITSPM